MLSCSYTWWRFNQLSGVFVLFGSSVGCTVYKHTQNLDSGHCATLLGKREKKFFKKNRKSPIFLEMTTKKPEGKKFPETKHPKYSYRCFSALRKSGGGKREVPWAKMKIDFWGGGNWRIWVDHRNWLNMLSKLRASPTSFLHRQISFGIPQTKYKWVDCKMWNIWPLNFRQPTLCRGDLMTIVEFITAILIPSLAGSAMGKMLKGQK